MTDDDLERELTPFREWHDAALARLESYWAERLSTHIAKIAKVIAPLTVSQGYIDRCKTDSCSITRLHNIRAAALDAEFMERTREIWDRYNAESGLS